MAKQGNPSGQSDQSGVGDAPVRTTPVKYSKMINLEGNPARLAEIFSKHYSVYPSYFVACLVAGAATLEEDMLKGILALGEQQAGKFGGLIYSNPEFVSQKVIDSVDNPKPATPAEA